MSFVIHEGESNVSNFPGDNLTTGRSETTSTLMPDGYDKFASGFDPWGDYLFGSVMIFVGKILHTIERCILCLACYYKKRYLLEIVCFLTL